jgi:hypothetical protein
MAGDARNKRHTWLERKGPRHGDALAAPAKSRPGRNYSAKNFTSTGFPASCAESSARQRNT